MISRAVSAHKVSGKAVGTAGRESHEVIEEGFIEQRPLSEGHPRPDAADEPHCITREELLQLAVGIHAAERRYLIGLTGPPGSGKSTLAEYLAKLLCPSPPIVPMDGFHLAQAMIDGKGLGGSKGSPETFDSWGFVNLVVRLARPAADTVVYAPEFDRDIGESIAGAIPVRPADGLVIVEGDYLLLDGISVGPDTAVTRCLCLPGNR